MTPTEDLLKRIDEYAEARERVKMLAAADDEQTKRLVLDGARDAWRRLLETREQFREGDSVER